MQKPGNEDVESIHKNTGKKTNYRNSDIAKPIDLLLMRMTGVEGDEMHGKFRRSWFDSTE